MDNGVLKCICGYCCSVLALVGLCYLYVPPPFCLVDFIIYQTTFGLIVLALLVGFIVLHDAVYAGK